ncbi:MAG: glycosyltransferase, partial [Myxococcales bacterium]|nr:glycosyltransferase [Myxococcales bacterium]
RLRILYCGRLIPLKGVDFLIRALAGWSATTDFLLDVVGDGPERARAERRLVELGLEQHVHFAGNRRDVADLLRCSDLMLLPSEIESFGLAALEAMSCGVPVIAAQVGGLEELIQHGTNGFLAPSGMIDEMARFVLELLDDDQRRESFRRAARETAQTRWRADPIIDLYDACYQRTLALGR